MPLRDSLISALAEAVTDGDHVDWPAAEARLTTSQDFDVASHLKALSTLTDRSATRPRGVTAIPRLTPLLEIVRVVAIVVSVIGAVGEILAVGGGGSREAALLSVVRRSRVPRCSSTWAATIDARARSAPATGPSRRRPPRPEQRGCRRGTADGCSRRRQPCGPGVSRACPGSSRESFRCSRASVRSTACARSRSAHPPLGVVLFAANLVPGPRARVSARGLTWSRSSGSHRGGVPGSGRSCSAAHSALC